ncbi:hypothetical protein AB0436_10875 [Streptomyces sp. NPDC051322]|uniref:hypothetical protein n=1 Tax=Streptomyces sp. NPDC051322 TaxID=3154645 RepID=UPI0034510468
MIRRLTVVAATALVAAFLATGAASAAPADHSQQLTPKEKAGLRVTEDVLGSLFGAAPSDLGF